GGGWEGRGGQPGGGLGGLGSPPRRGEEHLGRGDHLPAARVMLAAPELLVPEPVQVLHQVEVTAELEHRVLTDRVMGREEGTEVQTRHGQISWLMMMGPALTRGPPRPAPAAPGPPRYHRSIPWAMIPPHPP